MTTPRRDPEAGITMIEVTMVSFILGLVLAVILGVLVSVQRIEASTSTRLQNLEESRIVMAVLTRDLRALARDPLSGQTPLAWVTSASSTAVTFYAYLNVYADLATNATRAALPSRVSLTLATSGTRQTLTESLTPPVLSSGTYSVATAENTETLKRLVTSSIESSTTPFFTWENSSGTALNSTASPGVATASLGSINSVVLNVPVRKATTFGTPPTVVTTELRLPNVTVRP
jgi:type II secretory pathway component PulJ